MTSVRPYRQQPLTISDAIEELKRCSAAQFDPMVVRAFIKISKHCAIEHIVLHSDDKTPLLVFPACGPVIKIERDSKAGDLVFCNGCTGKFNIKKAIGGHLEVEFSGQYGSAADVAVKPDIKGIEGFVQKLQLEESVAV